VSVTTSPVDTFAVINVAVESFNSLATTESCVPVAFGATF
jgi:hypothetical protein